MTPASKVCVSIIYDQNFFCIRPMKKTLIIIILVVTFRRNNVLGDLIVAYNVLESTCTTFLYSAECGKCGQQNLIVQFFQFATTSMALALFQYQQLIAHGIAIYSLKLVK